LSWPPKQDDDEDKSRTVSAACSQTDYK